MSATLAETQRRLEMMTDLAAKYQAERDGFRAALETVAIPAIQDAAATARITECSPIPATDRLSMRLDRTLETLRAALSGAPVEDPRDATIRDLRERLETSQGAHRIACEVATKYQDEKIALAETACAQRSLLQKCSTALAGTPGYDKMTVPGQIDAENADKIRRSKALDAIRAAGVEPKP